MSPLKRAACVLAATAVTALATAAIASARLIDEFPRYTATAPRPVVRETVIRAVDGPSTLAYVLAAVGVCIALVAAGYLGAHLAMRRTSAQVG
jgi:hypothetical protein